METVDKILKTLNDFQENRQFSETYKDVFLYAEKYGGVVSNALQKNISDMLVDGYLSKEDADAIINPILTRMSEDITNVAKDVQQGINDVSGIGLKAQSVIPNQSKIDGIIQKVTSDAYEKTRWILGEPIINLAQTTVSFTQKRNIEWQSKAGLKPRIERKVQGKCCDWCEGLAGVYEYPDGVPNDIYRRHERCRCITEYVGNGKKVNIWGNKQKDDAEETISFIPAKSIKDAEEYAKQTFIDTSQFGAQGVSYTGIGLDVANEINKTFTEVFDAFNVKKIGGIIAPTANSKMGKLIDNAFAGYVKPINGFVINRKNAKSLSSATKELLRDNKLLRDVLSNPNNYDKSKFSSQMLGVIERSAKSGRGIYPEDIRSAIHHEIGHMISDDVKKHPLWESVEQEYIKLSEKISGYAGDNVGDFISESFSAYMNNDRDIVDDRMIKIFDSLRK